MSAFIMATVAIKDQEKFKEYGAKAGPTLGQYGGELLIHGTHARTLHGGTDHSVGAVIRFPDQESLQEWYDSPEYQALIDLRSAGADVTFAAYDTLG
ncbi:MAG: DUF1330 domain-containing protein [Thalassospira sp.]|uniref:DUF1330 domain-containing protein n=1 Tax=Thalassospira sp. TaxID=1912094 RepID=UPI0032EBE1FD